MRNTDRTCWTCEGSGYITVTVQPRDLVSFAQAIVESIVPFLGKRVKCPRCRGKGYYVTIRERWN